MTAEPTPDPAITYLFNTRQDRTRPAAPATAAPAADDDILVITDPVKFVDGVYKRALADLQALPHGQRNDGLNTVAFSLGRLIASNLLDEHTTEQFLEDACDIWPDRDPRNVTGTIRSGIRGGMRQPRPWVQGERTAADKPAPFVPVDPQTGVILELPVRDPALDALNAEIATQRARREARRLLDAEDAAASFREPPSRFTVKEELELPDEPVTYAIDQLLPVGGNALLTAQYKTGKTTVVGDLAAAHADGSAFLDRYELAPMTGRLAVFNYELSDAQYRRWLRELAVDSPERLAVLHLRGFRLPIIVPSVEDWVVRWLQEREVARWVVDPFARAFTGCGDENDNGHVGRFLDTLDVIKERAGVSELILPTHTGRMQHEVGQERARGATRLDDWADVRWMLNADDEGTRYFSASGRDVDVDEEALGYTESTRRLHIGGWDRKTAKVRGLEDKILAVLREEPGAHLTRLRDAVREKGSTAANGAVDKAIERLVGNHKVTVSKVGNTNVHHLGGPRPFGAMGVDD